MNCGNNTDGMDAQRGLPGGKKRDHVILDLFRGREAGVAFRWLALVVAEKLGEAGTVTMM